MVVAALTVQAADLPEQGSIVAVWKPQSLTFDYRSEGRLYQCDVLAYKITKILHRLGAGDRLELRGQCHDLAGQVHLELLMASPVEATPENIRDITSYGSEAELVARVRGIHLRSAVDVERFPAVWRSISFRRDSSLELDAGDCALVQQLRHQVLPKMSLQVTTDMAGIDCSQELNGIAKPRLTVLALVPVGSH